VTYSTRQNDRPSRTVRLKQDHSRINGVCAAGPGRGSRRPSQWRGGTREHLDREERLREAGRFRVGQAVSTRHSRFGRTASVSLESSLFHGPRRPPVSLGPLQGTAHAASRCLTERTHVLPDNTLALRRRPPRQRSVSPSAGSPRAAGTSILREPTFPTSARVAAANLKRALARSFGSSPVGR
jgi:hypothetical protein